MGNDFMPRGGGFAVRMRELDTWNRAVFSQEMIYPSDRIELFVRPDARVAGRNPAFRRNRGGLGDDQARSPHGARTQMHQMPVRLHAIH